MRTGPFWLALAATAAMALAACSDGSRGNKRVGERCSENDECRHGLCVTGVAGPEGVCTRSCAASTECPRGWSCSGATQDNVVICTRGAATPFGDGNE